VAQTTSRFAMEFLANNGVSGKNLSDSNNDKRTTYSGKKIAIHDNRAICAHAGA
jgi:hypothetical protein